LRSPDFGIVAGLAILVLLCASLPYMSIGHWGRMHRDYLREYHPIRFNELILTGQLWTYLAGLNEQAQVRMETLIEQLKTAEGVTESLKANDPMAWVQRMNSIRARAEEIVREKIIYGEAAV